MPTTDESHRRLEEEAAPTSVSIYRVDFICPACSGSHRLVPHLQFENGPKEAGSVAELFKGKAIPGAIQRNVLGNLLLCPQTGEYLSTEDPARVLLTPSRGI